MPDSYCVRPATLDDADVLVRHRMGMFADMGEPLADAVGEEFRRWLAGVMPSDAYRAWLVEAESGQIVAGGGVTLIPWPPGPRYRGGRLAFVYNVYTEPAHRRQGHALRLMRAIHAWCHDAGVSSLALNASQSGRRLYESMGYRITPSPMMFIGLDEVRKV